MTHQDVSDDVTWPALPLDAWRETYETLHLWTQIVGKVRLALSDWVNHYWHIALYVTPRGLTTSPIPRGTRIFQIDFDFIGHELIISSSDGRTSRLTLQVQSVAAFYAHFMAELDRLELPVDMHAIPCEVADPIPFAQDEQHRAYNPDYVNRFWRILVQADRVFKRFRADFIGKCSPVHYFWGAADLAVTRFSGRTAPPHPGGIPNLPDHVTREAYSHELCSCGFWPGGGPITYPAFYAYAYPEPAGFAQASVAPAGAFYSSDLREFILPYDIVRQADSPDEILLAFLQSTYDAAARLGRWERGVLERDR